MKKRVIAFLLTVSLLFGLAVPACAAEEQTAYYHAPVVFRDADGIEVQTQADFMIVEDTKKAKSKVYIKAEDLAELTGRNNYTYGQTRTECAYADSSTGHAVRFLFDSTEVLVYYMGGQLSYTAPCEALYQDEVAWVPFTYAMKLFGCTYAVLGNAIDITSYGMNPLAAATSVHNNLQQLGFDWVAEANLSVTDDLINMASASVAVAAQKLLTFKPSAWYSVLACLAGDSYAYDAEYAEQIAQLFITPAQQEANKLLQDEDALTEFTDDFTKITKNMTTEGLETFGDVVEKEYKTANITTKAFLSTDAFFDEISSFLGEIEKQFPQVKLSDKVNSLSSSIKKNITKTASNKIVENLNDYNNAIGKTVKNGAKGVFIFLDIVKYCILFINKSERATSALREYASFSTYRETDVFEQYASTSGNDIADAVSRYCLDHIDDAADDLINLPPAFELTGFVWDLVAGYAPFLSDALDSAESNVLSRYAIRYQNESMLNYYQARNEYLAQNGAGDEEAERVLNTVYAYLKFSFIARNAAAASYQSLADMDMNKAVMEENVRILENKNLMIAEYLNAMERDAFLPSDSQEFNAQWKENWDSEIAASIISIGTKATSPITQETEPVDELTFFPGQEADILTEEEAIDLVIKCLGKYYGNFFDSMLSEAFEFEVVDETYVDDKLCYVISMALQGETVDLMVFVPMDGTHVWFGAASGDGEYLCLTDIDILNMSTFEVIYYIVNYYYREMESTLEQQ